MSNFGDAALGGSRFMVMCLVPILAICALSFVTLPFMMGDEVTVGQQCAMVGIGLFCMLCILAVINAQRFWWAARGATLVIFLAYASFLITEISNDGDISGRKGTLAGFLVIGIPCLSYTIFGRFNPFRSETEPQMLIMTPDHLEKWRRERPILFDKDGNFREDSGFIIFVVPDDHFDDDGKYIGDFHDIDGNYFGPEEEALGEG